MVATSYDIDSWALANALDITVQFNERLLLLTCQTVGRVND